jgi:hypothetical protein
MTEERTVYQTDKSAEAAYLEAEMQKNNLHAGLRIWVRRAYRLKGLRWAMHMVNAWRKE